MKKIQHEMHSQRKKRYTLLTTFFIAISLLLCIVQMILSNRLASFGKELAYLSKDEQTLSLENEVLTKQIAEISSISMISQRARNLSFSQPAQFLVIGEQKTVALNR